jgi:hypothetical protein
MAPSYHRRRDKSVVLSFLLFIEYSVTSECEASEEEEAYAETNFNGNMYLLS